MKKELIEKFLKLNGKNCPAFQYENPLLDKNVANLLANCIVKLLNDHKYSQELRHLILKNVRDSCKHEPTHHLCVDDNITEILQDSYAVLIKDLNNNTIDTEKALDAFLIRNLKEVNICSIYEPMIKPDILQALANLKGSKDDMNEIILKDIIYWKIDDGKNHQYSDILKSLWDPDTLSDCKLNSDDLSIKNKSEIEKIILTVYKEILENEIQNLHEWLLEKKDFEKLFKLCAVSSECFQICCSIMTSLLIMSNFDNKMLNFIEIFISNVKIYCKEVYFSPLYPINIRHIVVLLDINICSLPGKERDTYIDCTLKHLNELYNESKSDAIMLLSHFKEWFYLYYNRYSQSSNE